MSNICIYVDLGADYLAQWFRHSHGGDNPVKLIRGSIESKILELYLTTRPKDEKPQIAGKGRVAIAIPTFRYRPPHVYNHLTRRANAALVSIIRDRFDMQLWADLHNFGNIISEQKVLIYAWMEANGIEDNETNWLAIAKRYKRLRDLYDTRIRAKKSYEKKKAKKCV